MLDFIDDPAKILFVFNLHVNELREVLIRYHALLVEPGLAGRVGEPRWIISQLFLEPFSLVFLAFSSIPAMWKSSHFRFLYFFSARSHESPQINLLFSKLLGHWWSIFRCTWPRIR